MLEPVSILGLHFGVAALYAVARPGTAVSSEARHVQVQAVAMVDRVERSDALFGDRAKVVSDLRTLARTHAEAGWDAGHASPVDLAAIETAVSFVRALPLEIAMPDVGVDPDGSVSLDWMLSRHRMLSITIAGDSDRLAYAWIDGSDRGSAVERFDLGSVPRRLQRAIESIAGLPKHACVRVA